MAKIKTYRVRFHAVQKSKCERFEVTKFTIGGALPHPSLAPPDFEAASLNECIAKVTELAKAVPVACRASVDCRTPPKPSGFDAATKALRFNMEKITFDHTDPWKEVA